MIQTFLPIHILIMLFHVNWLNLHLKSSKVCIIARSTAASLPFKGKVTKHTTVKWTIAATKTLRQMFLVPGNCMCRNFVARQVVAQCNTAFICLCICRDDTETSSLLDTWRIINLMRVLGAVLGWVLVAVQPTKDYTAREYTGPDNFTEFKILKLRKIEKKIFEVLSCKSVQVSFRRFTYSQVKNDLLIMQLKKCTSNKKWLNEIVS